MPINSHKRAGTVQEAAEGDPHPAPRDERGGDKEKVGSLGKQGKGPRGQRLLGFFPDRGAVRRSQSRALSWASERQDTSSHVMRVTTGR